MVYARRIWQLFGLWFAQRVLKILGIAQPVQIIRYQLNHRLAQITFFELVQERAVSMAYLSVVTTR